MFASNFKFIFNTPTKKLSRRFRHLSPSLDESSIPNMLNKIQNSKFYSKIQNKNFTTESQAKNVKISYPPEIKDYKIAESVKISDSCIEVLI